MENADCIIALPGGLGTWDELWEMVCLKGIGENVPEILRDEGSGANGCVLCMILSVLCMILPIISVEE